MANAYWYRNIFVVDLAGPSSPAGVTSGFLRLQIVYIAVRAEARGCRLCFSHQKVFSRVASPPRWDLCGVKSHRICAPMDLGMVRSARVKGIGRQGIVLKRRDCLQEEPMPCPPAPLPVQLRHGESQNGSWPQCAARPGLLHNRVHCVGLRALSPGRLRGARCRLPPPQPPALGNFTSRDSDTFLRSFGADSSSPQISAILWPFYRGNDSPRKSPQNCAAKYKTPGSRNSLPCTVSCSRPPKGDPKRGTRKKVDSATLK